MNIRYPNIDNIEHDFRMRVKEVWNWPVHEFSADMFVQLWPNTAGGFDAPGMVAMDAMTRECTTVVNCLYGAADADDGGEIYAVYFGDRFAYIVKNANEKFFKDLRNRRMARQCDAIERYMASIEGA